MITTCKFVHDDGERKKIECMLPPVLRQDVYRKRNKSAGVRHLRKENTVIAERALETFEIS